MTDSVFDPLKPADAKRLAREIVEDRVCIVVAFASRTRLRVVTAWRIKR